MKEFTTFESLLKPLSQDLLEACIKRFDADYYGKRFKLRDHLVAMLYGQLHELKSLRDLEIAFNSQKRWPLGDRGVKVKRSTLSDANRRRPASCFLWLAENLMTLLPRKKRKAVGQIVRKIDSSPIQLKGKGYDEWTVSHRTLRCQGLKLHVEYDGEVRMPLRARITHANVDDCRMGQSWPISADTIYLFDKGYYDFNWWWSLEEKQAFFVTRLKDNGSIKILASNVVSDESILEDSLFEFRNKHPRGGKRNAYSKPLRRIVVKREGKEKPLVLVSNLVEMPAEKIAELYKERWEIELFFKWIKQNLTIKKFIGRSENAVKIQLATALILYILLGLFKLSLKNKLSLHSLLIWIRHNLNTKRSIYRIIKPPEYYFPEDRIMLSVPGGRL